MMAVLIPASGVVQSTTPRVTGTGTPYTEIALTVNNGKAVVLVPDMIAEGTSTAAVLYSHGATGSSAELVFTPPPSGYRLHMAWLDRGWIVAAHDMHGPNTWSTLPALEDVQALYDWTARHWHIRDVILQGGSMGGLAAANLLGRDMIPDVRGTILANNVVDLTKMGDWQPSILSTWGAADTTDLVPMIAGFDPARDDPQRWADKPLWMTSGTSDTIVPVEQHADVFYARAATPDKITYVRGSQSHGTGYDNPEADAWLSERVADYDPTQEPSEYLPRPSWPDEPPAQPVNPPGPPPVVGVCRTDGTPVGLYRTDGTPVGVAAPIT